MVRDGMKLKIDIALFMSGFPNLNDLNSRWQLNNQLCMYNYFSRNAQQAYSDKLNNNLYCKTHGVKKKKKNWRIWYQFRKKFVVAKNLIEWTACRCPIWLFNPSSVCGKYCDWCPILSGTQCFSKIIVLLRIFEWHFVI